MTKKKLRNAVFIFIALLFVGYIFSLLTKKNTYNYFENPVQIKIVPFVHIYTEVLEGVGPKGAPVGICPATNLVNKGTIIPIIHFKIESSSTYIPYEGPCF